MPRIMLVYPDGQTTSTAKVAAAIIKVGRLFNHTSVS